ncbi:MAG: cupin domain-containing protein [Bacillus subtilis]|nr:cupin domain-containing protein [Bacillus subtilis]
MIGNIEQLKATPIVHPEAANAAMKVLVGATEGWTDHVMRVVEVAPGGYSPKHSHPWFHVNYILSGEGKLMIDGVETPIQSGSYAYIPGNTIHQFKNVGTSTLRFICIVPKEGHR